MKPYIDIFDTRTLYQDWRPQNLFIDTPGLFQDTVISIRMEMETGIWIKRTDSSKTTAQSSQKLAEFTILCDYIFFGIKH